MSKKSGANAAPKSKKNQPKAEPKSDLGTISDFILGREDSASQPQPDPITSNEKAEPTAHDAPSAPPNAAIKPPFIKDQNMTLNFKSLDKRGRNAIYTGAAVSMRFPVGAFPNKTAPPTLEFADGSFAGPKGPKPPMTAEERKAARKAAPKLTLAEKVAKAEERTAKLREKLAADAAKASAPAPEGTAIQPSL